MFLGLTWINYVSIIISWLFVVYVTDQIIGVMRNKNVSEIIDIYTLQNLTTQELMDKLERLDKMDYIDIELELQKLQKELNEPY